MNKYNKILVVCPGGVMTAGPEAIHQFVADLVRSNQNAAVVYHPFDKQFDTPTPYQKYAIDVALYEDLEGDLIMFPEIFPTLALKVKNAKAGIWWMSVNNYTCNRYGNPIRDKFRYFKNLVRGKRPLLGFSELRHLLHYAQSDYAKQFLLDNRIESFPLSDPIPVYTSKDYLENLKVGLGKTFRDNVILFNPHKGINITSKLMKAYPEWVFKPLKGYNREQLAEIFLSSKIYIDFGHHPGKDRLPREAAIHGCCVITGVYGSASNSVDLPFPDKYKLNDQNSSFIKEFGAIVNNCFINFEHVINDFLLYREIISKEQIVFDQQFISAFGINCDDIIK
jgi:hypothetical protein